VGGEHRVRGLDPKIVDLLGRPESAAARLELETCEKLGVSPSQFHGRPTVTTYIYDEHVDVWGRRKRGEVLRVVTSSAWSAEDRLLIAAWRTYKASIHERCGHPIATAMHPDNEGWFEQVDEVTCWACTAAEGRNKDGTTKPVTFPVVVYTRDEAEKPLPPIRPHRTSKGTRAH
jgi:hypothetical protein